VLSVFASGIWSQLYAQPASLPSDYYAKDWGVIPRDALIEIAAKEKWTPADYEKILGILRHSSPRRLAEIQKNIDAFSRKKPAGDELTLLLELREELAFERKTILDAVIQQITKGDISEDKIGILVAASKDATDKELISLSGVLPVLAAGISSDSAKVALFSLLEAFAQKGLLSNENLQFDPSLILVLLEEMSKSEDTYFIRPKSRTLLVRSGSPYGKALILRLLENASSPETNETMLAEYVPESLQLISISPQSEFVPKIIEVGRNVSRSTNPKLWQSYLNNFSAVVNAYKAAGNPDADNLMRFIDEQVKSPGNTEWQAACLLAQKKILAKQ